MPTLLILLLVIPLASAIIVALIGGAQPLLVRRVSLASTLLSLLLSAIVCLDFAVRRFNPPEPSPAADATGVLGSTNPLGAAAAAIELRGRTPTTFTPQHATRFDLVSFSGKNAASVQFYIGIDGLNVWLILLTALLMVPAVLCSWTAITERVNEYHAWLLALQMAMVGVFLSFDVVLFYVFFELTLVPLFFMIGLWGGPERQYAARKFFVYTLAGSLITLLGVIGIVLTLSQKLDGEDRAAKPTFAIPELIEQSNARSRALPESAGALLRVKKNEFETEAKNAETEAKKLEAENKISEAGGKKLEAQNKDTEARTETAKLVKVEQSWDFWRKVQLWVFAAMMVGFAVKVPLFPVHTWLPLAHVEAPTAGSVLLAGVLLKLGTYGFLRLCLPLAPDAALTFGAPLIGWLAVIGIIYGSFCSLAQDDIKKLIAYSSVAHLGYCMLGLFALNETGLSGGLLQMINHGLSTGALFLLVGMLYERYHMRKMADYGGMAARLKLLGTAMVFVTMSSVGLPGLNGFVGEALVLFGMFQFEGGTVAGRTLTVIASCGMLLGAWYMLTMLKKVFFGPLHEPHHSGHGPIADLNGREIATLAPLALLCLFLGIYPKPFLDAARPELKLVAHFATEVRERRAAPQPTATVGAPVPQVAATPLLGD